MNAQPPKCGKKHPVFGGNGWIRRRRPKGAATLDYILLLCMVLPMAVFVLWAGPRIMNLVYQMLCVLVSWPFL